MRSYPEKIEFGGWSILRVVEEIDVRLTSLEENASPKDNGRCCGPEERRYDIHANKDAYEKLDLRIDGSTDHRGTPAEYAWCRVYVQKTHAPRMKEILKDYLMTQDDIGFDGESG